MATSDPDDRAHRVYSIGGRNEHMLRPAREVHNATPRRYPPCQLNGAGLSIDSQADALALMQSRLARDGAGPPAPRMPTLGEMACAVSLCASSCGGGGSGSGGRGEKSGGGGGGARSIVRYVEINRRAWALDCTAEELIERHNRREAEKHQRGEAVP